MVGRVSCLIDKRNMNLFQLAQICEITCSTVSNSKRQARRLSVDKGYDREDMRVSGVVNSGGCVSQKQVPPAKVA